jgi:hypothetical protein
MVSLAMDVISLALLTLLIALVAFAPVGALAEDKVALALGCTLDLLASGSLSAPACM